MAEHEQPTRLLDCPECGTALAVLPVPLYGRTESWEKTELAALPGDSTDLEGRRVAKVTVVDGDGQYLCPQCGKKSFVPGVRA